MVSFWFYPSRGGLEQQAWQLCQRLRARGVEVVAVTARRPALGAFEIVDGIPIHRVWAGGGRGLDRAGSVASYANVAVFCLSLFCFLLFVFRFDVIHVHQAIFPAFVATLAAKITRKPIIVKISGTGASGNVAQLRRRWFNRMMLMLIRRADAFIAPTRDAREELIRAGFDATRIVEIPNGVDTQAFRPRPRDALGVVLCAARFTHEKGHATLLRAWQFVKVPDARLIFVGEGPLRHKMQTLAADLRITNYELRGEVEDMAGAYSNASLFALPSLAEGMSNALLEAMACGLPCIASDIPANAELIQDGVNGLLFPVGDARALAERIETLLNDRALAQRLGDAARKTVETRYAFECVTDAYEALYRKLIE
jgi:glycosyltransferase involved in cell wall biosynthesis